MSWARRSAPAFLFRIPIIVWPFSSSVPAFPSGLVVLVHSPHSERTAILHSLSIV